MKKLAVVLIVVGFTGCGLLYHDDGTPTDANKNTAVVLQHGKETGDAIGGPLGLILSSLCGIGGVVLAGVNRHQKKKAENGRVDAEALFSIARKSIDDIKELLPEEHKERLLDGFREVLSGLPPELVNMYKTKVKEDRGG